MMDNSKDPLSVIKDIYSTVLLIFSIVIVFASMVEKQTGLSQDFHPVFAFVCLCAAMLWLSMVEGGQASVVGLAPVDHSLYKDSHPISYAICKWAHTGDNLDRFVMGRQFMVLALVFIINLAGHPLEHAKVLNLPDILIEIFIGSGIAMILFTCMVGQLNTEVNAAHCMLDFINTHFMTITMYASMGIEASGLLHCTYLMQLIVAKLAGQPLVSKEPPRDGMQNFLFWIRILISCGLVIAAFIYTLGALFAKKTTMWEGIPPIVSILFFFALMCVVGMLEAIQIAFYAVARITEEERNKNIWAKKSCQLLFHGDNLPAFLVGRQLMVVSCFFIIARCTTMDIAEGESNVMGVSDSVQKFFDTGLLGALITTTVGSIAWRLLASAFPMAFISTPITYILLRACLFLEGTGICNGAWVIARIVKKFAGYQPDEVYIGTAEERAAKKHADDDNVLNVEAGHMYPVAEILTPFHERYHTLEEIEEDEKKIDEQIAELENRRQRLADAKKKLGVMKG